MKTNARMLRTIAGVLPMAPIASIAVCCAVLLPLILMPALPLFDVANHLARLYALGDVPGSLIRISYVPHWALMPDLGVDLAYEALKSVASPEVVIRICLVGSLVLLLAAMWRMQRLFWGATSYSMALAPVFIIGLCVFMGYLNYILSIAIVFAALALYLCWRPHLSVARIGALACLSVAAWLAHVAGFCVFVLLFCIIDLTGRWLEIPVSAHGGSVWIERMAGGRRTLALMVAIFGPATALFPFAEHQLPHAHILYGGLEKVRFLLAPAFLTNGGADLAVLGFGVVLLILTVSSRAFSMPPILRPAVILLAALIVICPFKIGQAADVDGRLVMPLLALMLGGGRLIAPSRVVEIGFLACLMTVTLLREYAFIRLGNEAAREIARFRSLAKRLPLGSAMLVVDNIGPARCVSAAREPVPPLVHLVSFAAIDRGIYSAMIFTGTGMQPLRARRPPFPSSTVPIAPRSVEELQAATRASVTPPPAAGDTTWSSYWPGSYQSLLVLHDGCGMNPVPARLDIIGSGDSFSVFSVRPGGPAASTAAPHA